VLHALLSLKTKYVLGLAEKLEKHTQIRKIGRKEELACVFEYIKNVMFLVSAI
jgi:hypothetical protein